MREEQVKVTTTQGFDRVKIAKYLGPVTAHITIGMNVFKDLSSAITDFWGGRSKAYQNTLQEINNDAIVELRHKAWALGANCVLGLKVDTDEIAAQGKSMLMVTAVGTAAIADFKSKEAAEEEMSDPWLSQESFKVIARKNSYIYAASQGNLKTNAKFWDFVTRYQLDELAPQILDDYEERIEKLVDPKELDPQVLEYFQALEPEPAQKALYRRLANKKSSTLLKTAIKNIIITANLVDFHLSYELLQHKDFDTRKLGLLLLTTGYKSVYLPTDKEPISKTIEELPELFPRVATFSTKKKALSSKEKEIWICQCGKENNMENEHCSRCEKDVYGFYADEKNIQESIIYLKAIHKILVDQFG